MAAPHPHRLQMWTRAGDPVGYVQTWRRGDVGSAMLRLLFPEVAVIVETCSIDCGEPARFIPGATFVDILCGDDDGG